MEPPSHPLSARRAVLHRDNVRRLRDILRSNIVHGAYRGAKMPSEAELMQRHDAARAVVREALQSLRDEGLIDRLQGYGTYALESPKIQGLSDSHGIAHVARTGFWGDVTHSSVLSRRPVPTPDAVQALMPSAGERVYELDYVLHVHTEVVAGATNYFRYPEADRVEHGELGTDFYEFIERAGLELGATSLTIGTSIADASLTASAGLAPRTPILTLEQTVSDMSGEIFDVAFIWLRGDRFLLNSFAALPHYPVASR